MGQSGTGHAGLSVGSERRSWRAGGLCVDRQRWILSVLHAGNEPWDVSAGLCWRTDRGGETAGDSVNVCGCPCALAHLLISDQSILSHPVHAGMCSSPLRP